MKVRQRLTGIIPAREASKRLPNKNLLRLSGKPLIAWSIEAALKSRCLDRVIVSTDSEEIAETARKWGAEVPFLRPRKLASGSTPTLPVLQHAVRWLESHGQDVPSLIVTLQPTSPLRRPEHIQAAVRLMNRTRADSVVTVCREELCPALLLRLKNGKVYLPFTARSRDSSQVYYRINGAVYVTRYEVLMKRNRILGRDTRALIMDPESSIDIDTSLDFKMAALVLKEKNPRD